MKLFINTIKKLDFKILKLVKNGLKFSFVFCLFATLILFTYEIYSFPLLFYFGISLFKSSLYFALAFIAFGIAFDKLQKQIN